MLTATFNVNPADARLAQNCQIALVVSQFNTEIIAGLQEGAVFALTQAGILASNIHVLSVPGAFEIPLVAKKAAASGKFSGVIALGCVIRGDTPHFEFVSLAATLGCLTAGLDTGVPVLFGVITVNTLEQARERSQPNDFNKGREAALSLLRVLETLARL